MNLACLMTFICRGMAGYVYRVDSVDLQKNCTSVPGSDWSGLSVLIGMGLQKHCGRFNPVIGLQGHR